MDERAQNPARFSGGSVCPNLVRIHPPPSGIMPSVTGTYQSPRCQSNRDRTELLPQLSVTDSFGGSTSSRHRVVETASSRVHFRIDGETFSTDSVVNLTPLTKHRKRSNMSKYLEMCPQRESVRLGKSNKCGDAPNRLHNEPNLPPLSASVAPMANLSEPRKGGGRGLHSSKPPSSSTANSHYSARKHTAHVGGIPSDTPSDTALLSRVPQPVTPPDSPNHHPFTAYRPPAGLGGKGARPPLKRVSITPYAELELLPFEPQSVPSKQPAFSFQEAALGFFTPDILGSVQEQSSSITKGRKQSSEKSNFELTKNFVASPLDLTAGNKEARFHPEEGARESGAGLLSTGSSVPGWGQGGGSYGVTSPITAGLSSFASFASSLTQLTTPLHPSSQVPSDKEGANPNHSPKNVIPTGSEDQQHTQKYIAVPPAPPVAPMNSLRSSLSALRVTNSQDCSNELHSLAVRPSVNSPVDMLGKGGSRRKGRRGADDRQREELSERPKNITNVQEGSVEENVSDLVDVMPMNSQSFLTDSVTRTRLPSSYLNSLTASPPKGILLRKEKKKQMNSQSSSTPLGDPLQRNGGCPPLTILEGDETSSQATSAFTYNSSVIAKSACSDLSPTAWLNVLNTPESELYQYI